MTQNRFFVLLSVLIVLMVMGVLWIQQNSEYTQHVTLYYSGIAGFALHNVFFFFIANVLSNKSHHQKYIGMVYMSVLTKLVIGISIPVAYHLIHDNPKGFYIMPFIFIYIFFTVFETYVLNKLAVMR